MSGLIDGIDKEIFQKSPDEHIINTDEAGLDYKCLWNKTLARNVKICIGQKNLKERLSILFATDMNGGKSEKAWQLVLPQNHPHTNNHLHFYRKAVKTLWITGSIFEV
ncbi:tigger transposable element-derived protein 4-like [Plakobranchus ocellatus]|uniref:Tigger transposable element-derived protein 4-like n=1 Tax=Plakobranchus ocellatus TaxID=259542 RepID=A0AAV4BI91_9GAST|nr:tigger transposable element-derived protein 4-like [Plakobranchus ocellatus]